MVEMTRTIWMGERERTRATAGLLQTEARLTIVKAIRLTVMIPGTHVYIRFFS